MKQRIRTFSGKTHPKFESSAVWKSHVGFFADLVLAFPQLSQLLLHLSSVTGCLCHLTSLQVSLCQQLFDVLLLLLQSFLQRCGSRNLTSIASRRLRQLKNDNRYSLLTFCLLAFVLSNCFQHVVGIRGFKSCLQQRSVMTHHLSSSSAGLYIHKFGCDSQWSLRTGITSEHRVSLTSPARLGLPLIEEVAELSELTEDALGLILRVDLLRELFALVGVVQGKPMRVTLWTGANRPYLGKHWKYLKGKQVSEQKPWSLLLWEFYFVLCQCSLLHLVPATAPSFLPRGSSSSTPHHSPLAKSVSPRNRTTPALVPPTYT